MLRIYACIATIFVAMAFNAAFGEQFHLKVQRGYFVKIERPGDSTFYSDNYMKCVELVKNEGEITETLDFLVTTDQPFSTQYRFGNSTFTVEGKVGATDAFGRHLVKLKTEVLRVTGKSRQPSEDEESRWQHLAVSVAEGESQFLEQYVDDSTETKKSSKPGDVKRMVLFMTLDPVRIQE